MNNSRKLKQLVIAGIIGVALGLILNPVTPIIKRICTSSFIIESGGWCLLVLALFYWIVDIRGYKKWTGFMVTVGMNSIFLYMWSQLLGGWTRNFIGIFAHPFLEPLGVWGEVIHMNLYLLVIWYLAYWLYKRKIVIAV